MQPHAEGFFEAAQLPEHGPMQTVVASVLRMLACVGQCDSVSSASLRLLRIAAAAISEFAFDAVCTDYPLAAHAAAGQHEATTRYAAHLREYLVDL